jgi:hypothetical protein
LKASLDQYIADSERNPDIAVLRDAWILDRATGGGDLAVRLRLQQLWSEEPDKGLALIIRLAKDAESDADRADIAECLEWLLGRHGQAYWDIINRLCAQSGTFRSVVALVWGASLSKDLRRKVEMWRR